eukprot:1155038-Pelagomonas_calceolata.AAC.5
MGGWCHRTHAKARHFLYSHFAWCLSAGALNAAGWGAHGHELLGSCVGRWVKKLKVSDCKAGGRKCLIDEEIHSEINCFPAACTEGECAEGTPKAGFPACTFRQEVRTDQYT